MGSRLSRFENVNTNNNHYDIDDNIRQKKKKITMVEIEREFSV